MPSAHLPGLYLILVAAIWGVTIPLMEQAVSLQDPFTFLSIRFTLAALPLLPYFLRHLDRYFLQLGSWLGLMHCIAFLFQLIGLQTVDASRGAFLTSTYVLWIPLLSSFFGMGWASTHELLSSLICLVGIYVLTGCDLQNFSKGDSWIIASALSIAMTIIYISKHGKAGANLYMLAYCQIVMTALFSWVPTLLCSDLDFSPLWLEPELLTIHLFCSLLGTVVAIGLQAKYQKQVSLQNVALIFSLEPLFALLTDSCFKSTLPSLSTLVGGMIIIGSIIYLELMKPKATTEAALSS